MMKYNVILAICLLAACKKDKTTTTQPESTKTKHTISYQVIIKSDGDAAFKSISYDQFNDSSISFGTTVVNAIEGTKFYSDTMTFYEDSARPYIEFNLSATATATVAGRLTLQAWIDDNVMFETTVTGTELEATLNHTYEFQ